MSYCRWSSDDFGCDVYVYESVNGWITHVCNNRVLGNVPKLPPLNPVTVEDGTFYFAYRVQMAFMETASRARIGLPHDGEEFVDDTPGECADRLEQLRAMGYRVPQYAIDTLREEQAEPLVDEPPRA